MPPPSPPRVPWRGRLLVLAGILLVALNLRIAVAAVSPILDVVRQDVDLSAAEVGLLGTVPVAAFAVVGSWAPLIGRRIGLEPALVLAMVLAAVGEVARAATQTSGGFLAWSVVALAGMGMGNVLLPPVVKRYFPDRIGPVTAAYSVAMAISTAVPPLLSVPLARELGWRLSLASLATVAVVATVPWLVVVARSARARAGLGEVLRRAPQETPVLASRHRGTGRVWRSPLAWALAVTFGMNSLNTYALFAWLPQMLVDAGLPPETGGLWLALFAILGLPASLVVPLLAVRLRNPGVVVVSFSACFVGGYLGLLLAPTAALPLWMVLLGLGPGTFPLLLALLNLRTRTSAGASSLSGFTQGVGYALSAVGPIGVGLLYEVTGGWVASILALLGTVLVLCAAGLVASRPVMLEDTWHPRGTA